MAIGDRVTEAIQRMAASDFENAAVQISIAVDATAKAIYSQGWGVGKRFRTFIDDNEEFLLFVALGCGVRFIFSGDGTFVFADKGRLSNALYKYVRNALLHDGDLSENVIVTSGPVVGMEESKFILSSELLTGLILLVMGVPENAKQKLGSEFQLVVGGVRMMPSELWGNLHKIKSDIGFTHISR